MGRIRRIRERKLRCAQQKKQLTGPKQDIQQSPSLEIVQIFAMEADVEGLPRAFLNERSPCGQVQGVRLELAGPGVERLKLFITTQQKVIQAESLLIQ